MINAQIMALIVAAAAASMPRVPAVPRAKAPPPTVPILVTSKGPLVSVPSAGPSSTVTGASINGSSAASTASSTTRLLASGSNTVTLLSSNGQSVTRTVDAKTAQAVKNLSGTSVKVSTAPNGTIAIQPLVQTMTGHVTAVAGNRITVKTATGTVTQIIASTAKTALRAGTTVTAVTSNAGQNVTLIPIRPRNPLQNVLVGTVKAVSTTAATVASSTGVHRVAITPALVPALKARVGKTVAITTTSGTRVATSLVKTSTLNSMIAVAKDPPPLNSTLVATVTEKSNTTVELRTADGVVHDALCGALCANLPVAAASAAGQAFLAIITPGDFVQQIVPLPDESRMVGQIVSYTDDLAIVLLPAGGVVTLSCSACATVMPQGLSAGDVVLLQLDSTGKVIGALPFPKSGILTGTVLSVSPTTMTLRTQTGKTIRLYCDCAQVNVTAGQLVAVGLNSSGTIASVAPLAQNDRLTGQVLSRDGRIITVESDPRNRFTLSVPPADPMPLEGSVVTVAFTPDSAVQNVSLESPPPQPCRHNGKPVQCAKKPRAIANVSVQIVQPLVAPMLTDNCSQRSGSVLTVGVVNKSTRLPLPHASVSLLGPAPVHWTTSSDGYVVFKNVPVGKYVVQISKPGYTKAESEQLRIACARSLQLAALLNPLRAAMSTSSARARAVHRKRAGHPKMTKCSHTGAKGSTSRWVCRL